MWLVCGILTLFGALICAELARAFPRTGGVYVYLKEAYSPALGFLWGWAMFWSMHSGIIAAIAVVFARYVGYFVPLGDTGIRLVAIGAIELHPWNCTVEDIEHPDVLVFDLDPGEGTNVLHCARVAFLLRDVLKELRLKCFPKVSGSKGIQLYLPLNRPITYEATQAFARAIAELLERKHGDLLVADMAKNLRVGKIFIVPFE